MALQRCTVAVATDEYKLGMLEVGWNRDRCCAILRGKNRGQCAYLVSQVLKLEIGGIAGNEIPRDSINNL